MRRVRREEVEIVRADPMRALEICLDHWRTWMGMADMDLGSPKRVALLVGDGDAYGENGDDEEASPSDGNAYYRNAGMVGEAVDAEVRSLPKHLQWAMKRRCGLATQWIYPHLVLYDAIMSAESQLIERLKKNVATRALF
jgi:hypothetical protein